MDAQSPTYEILDNSCSYSSWIVKAVLVKNERYRLLFASLTLFFCRWVRPMKLCELPYIFHTRFTTSSSFTFWTSMYPWRCITFIFRKYIQSFTLVYLFNEANDRRRYKKTQSGSMIIRAKFQYCSPWSFPWKKSKLRQLSKHFNFIHTTMRILLSWVV